MNSIADWEQWVKLFRENPEEFERERLATIEELIMSQPVYIRHRSRQLQWRIDAVRRRAPNSLSACIRIYDMMIESVYGPGGLLDVINGSGSEPLIRPRVRKRKTGVCLKLTRPERNNPGSPS